MRHSKQQLSKADLQKMIGDAVSSAVADHWKQGDERARRASERRHTTGYGPTAAAPVQPKSRRCKLKDLHPDEMNSKQKSAMAGQCIKYLAVARNNPWHAVELAEQNGDKMLAEIWSKALGEDTLAGGGALLPPEFAEGIVEELGAQSVVMSSGVTRMSMNNGALTLPFLDASATAAYTGENTNITKSEPTFGQLELSNRKLASLVPMSNDLMRDTQGAANNIVSNHMVRVMRRKMDVTLIRSVGTSSEPQGMLFQAVTGNKFNANGTVNVDNVTLDLGLAVQKLEDLDVDLDGSPGWILNPRSKKFLMTARDGNGNLVWEPEMKGTNGRNGTIMGFPWKMTSQIPNNLGGGTESEVYFAAFDSLVLAENTELRVEVFPGGAYHDGSNVISGISQDQTVIRSIALHDFGAQHRGSEISVIEAVKWGV